MKALLAMALAFWLAGASAHEVLHAVERADAVTVRLTYADGKPFAYEAFEATPQGAQAPSQVGRTDAEGRAVFIAGTARQWRLRAFSADGHGVDLRFEVPAPAAVAATQVPANGDGPNRASLLLFGLAALLAAFGFLQLWLRRKP